MSSSPSSLSLAASTGTSGSDGASDANDASARGADEQERLALAMAIRRNLMRDDTLSVAAHNVTVLVHDDTVTLRGLVASARERSVVVAAARQAAPGYRIDDALHVQR